jgi:hypothetical protein
MRYRTWYTACNIHSIMLSLNLDCDMILKEQNVSVIFTFGTKNEVVMSMKMSP